VVDGVDFFIIDQAYLSALATPLAAESDADVIAIRSVIPLFSQTRVAAGEDEPEDDVLASGLAVIQ
jgi:hypothetical protein